MEAYEAQSKSTENAESLRKREESECQMKGYNEHAEQEPRQTEMNILVFFWFLSKNITDVLKILCIPLC